MTLAAGMGHEWRQNHFGHGKSQCRRQGGPVTEGA